MERGTGGSRAKDIPVSSQHQSGGKEEEEEEATIDVSSPSPPCARVSVGERSSHFLPFLFHNHTRHHHTCGLELQRTKKAKEQPTVIWTHSGTMIANPVADIFTLRTHVSLRVAKGDIHVGERTWFSQSAVSRIHACQNAKNEFLLSYPAFLQKVRFPFSLTTIWRRFSFCAISPAVGRARIRDHRPTCTLLPYFSSLFSFGQPQQKEDKRDIVVIEEEEEKGTILAYARV